MNLNSLPPLTKLPTTFFPSPQTFSNEEPRTIVVSYDYSNYGDAMIAKSIHSDLIRATDDIRLIYVINQNDFRNIFAPALPDYGAISKDLEDKYLSELVDAFMWEIITALNKRGFNSVSSEILRGDPKEVIIDYCRSVKPLYLITGSRGLGTLKRTVMGSVSSYLTKHCPTPVLVVRLNNEEIEARKEMNKTKKNTFMEVLAEFDYPQPI